MIFMVLKLLWVMLKCCHNHRLSDGATRTLNSSIAAMAWYELASFPGSQQGAGCVGEGKKREPGIHCLRMRRIICAPQSL